MPVISGSCCGTVWYCTPAGPVEVAVGTAPPAGFTGGPWATEVEASACPVPDIYVLCCGAQLRLPGELWITLTDKLGNATNPALPNSMRTGPGVIVPAGVRYSYHTVSPGGFSVNFYVEVQCPPTFGEGSSGSFNWLVLLGGGWEQTTPIDYYYYMDWSPSNLPWGVGFWGNTGNRIKAYTCDTDTIVPAPEVLGTLTAHSFGASFQGSATVTLSR